MNLFFLDKDPVIAASMMCNQHINKQITETCQMISAAYYQEGSKEKPLNHNWLYGKAYYNHVSTRWVRLSYENFIWTRNHLAGLLEQFDVRFDSSKHQRAKQFLEQISISLPEFKNDEQLTIPHLAFGSEDAKLNAIYKQLQQKYGVYHESLKAWIPKSWDEAVIAYQDYYCHKVFKNGKLPCWSKTSIPSWYVHKNNAH